MRVYVLHLFVDGVLSETRVFGDRADAQQAEWSAYVAIAEAVVREGAVMDVNGSIWTGAIEAVEVE